MSFVRSRPILTSALSLGAAGGLAVYLGKRYLDRSIPRVPLTQVPRTSACRNLVDSTTDASAPYTPWGLEKGCLLPPWSGGKNGDRWIHSFSALQIEIPTALLAGYKPNRSVSSDGPNDDVDHLMKNLLTAFLDARAKGPDGWLIDEKVPPLSFQPGSHLYGSLDGFVAFLLGTWNSTRGTAKALQPLALPADAREPTATFPSNSTLLQQNPTDAAASVMYSHSPANMFETVGKAAAYGWPWQFMLGGFQEWIVQKVSDDTVRVTYVMVECSDSKSGFRPMPQLGYEAHVLYGQCLLDRAVREMKTVSLQQTAKA